MLEPIRRFNNAYPIEWRDLPDGGRETDSRGVRCRKESSQDGPWDTFTSESSTGDLHKPVIQAAQPAIQAAGKLAEFIRGWADDLKDSPIRAATL